MESEYFNVNNSMPEVISGMLTPFIAKKWQALFQQIENDPETLKEFGMHAILKQNFDTWRSKENQDAFVEKQTRDIQAQFEDIKRIFDNYYTSFFKVFRSCQGLSAKEFREISIERPSLSAFVKSVYWKNMRAILRNSDLIGTEDEEDFLTDMISDSIITTIKRMIPYDIMREKLREMQSCCDALAGKDSEEQDSPPDPEKDDESGDGVGTVDETEEAEPLSVSESADPNALSTRYPKKGKFKRGEHNDAVITHNKGDTSVESLADENDDAFSEVSSSAVPSRDRPVQTTDYPDATSTPKDLPPPPAISRRIAQQSKPPQAVEDDFA